MTPTEVVSMFRSYADEDDGTFLTDTQVALYLRNGYSDFRRSVCNVDPYIYSKSFLFELSDSNILDLETTTPPLAGINAVAGTKLERVLRVASINSLLENKVIEYLSGSPSEGGMALFGYALTANKIILGGTSNGTFRLEYVPQHGVVFDPSIGISPYLDDLDSFHDMIPLYAYRRYAIRDGADSPQVLGEMANKEYALANFLQSGRSNEGSSFVSHYSGGW